MQLTMYVCMYVRCLFTSNLFANCLCSYVVHLCTLIMVISVFKSSIDACKPSDDAFCVSQQLTSYLFINILNFISNVTQLCDTQTNISRVKIFVRTVKYLLLIPIKIRKSLLILSKMIKLLSVMYDNKIALFDSREHNFP